MELNKNYKFLTAPTLVLGIDIPSWIISIFISTISYWILQFICLSLFAFMGTIIILCICYIFFLINIKKEPDFIMILINKIKIGRTLNKEFKGNCYVA
jgi:hypothetical protein